jgi:uncharacterized protein (TIGR00159 family)
MPEREPMNESHHNCDFSPILSNIKEDMAELTAEIKRIVDSLDDNNCLLGEFRRITERFNGIEEKAATFYLNCYLSPYTSKYFDLSHCLRNLSSRHHGALIVVERKESIVPYMQNGTPINAEISMALLESIFYPGNPLHDGAVFIRSEHIVSAKNILPLSQTTDISEKLGTRHRAAIGLTERSDAVALVVSEETGTASFAVGGQLHPISIPH